MIRGLIATFRALFPIPKAQVEAASGKNSVSLQLAVSSTKWFYRDPALLL